MKTKELNISSKTDILLSLSTLICLLNQQEYQGMRRLGPVYHRYSP
jgi:hypothetical protein